MKREERFLTGQEIVVLIVIINIVASIVQGATISLLALILWLIYL